MLKISKLSIPGTLIICLLSLYGLSHAAIYEYTDENGKTFYVDDKNKIPEQYRQKSETFLATPTSSVAKKKFVAKQTAKKQKTKSILIDDQASTDANRSTRSSLPKHKTRKSEVTNQLQSFQINSAAKSSRPKARKGSGY